MLEIARHVHELIYTLHESKLIPDITHRLT